jgi:hypothetical protein
VPRCHFTGNDIFWGEKYLRYRTNIAAFLEFQECQFVGITTVFRSTNASVINIKLNCFFYRIQKFGDFPSMFYMGIQSKILFQSFF